MKRKQHKDSKPRRTQEELRHRHSPRCLRSRPGCTRKVVGKVTPWSARGAGKEAAVLSPVGEENGELLPSGLPGKDADSVLNAMQSLREEFEKSSHRSQDHYRGQRLGVLCVQSGRELGLCSLLCTSLYFVGTSPKRASQWAVSNLRPKGAPLNPSPEYILSAADELNGRPRKKLGYRTRRNCLTSSSISVYAAEGCGSIAQDGSQRLPS